MLPSVPTGNVAMASPRRGMRKGRALASQLSSSGAAKKDNVRDLKETAGSPELSAVDEIVQEIPQCHKVLRAHTVDRVEAFLANKLKDSKWVLLVNEIAEMAHNKHFDSKKSTIGLNHTDDVLAFMGISPQQLTSAGLSKELVNRVFVALWVYGVGFHDILTSIAKQCGQSKRTNGVLASVWKVFTVLLEGYASKDYVMAITQVERKSEELLENVTKRLGKQVATILKRERDHIVARDQAVGELQGMKGQLQAMEIEKKEIIEQWNELHLRHQTALVEAERFRSMMEDGGDAIVEKSKRIEDLELHVQELNTQIVSTVQHWRLQNKALQKEINDVLERERQCKLALETQERSANHQVAVMQKVEADKQQLEMKIIYLTEKLKTTKDQLLSYANSKGDFQTQIDALEDENTKLLETQKQDAGVIAVLRKLLSAEKESIAIRIAAYEDLIRGKDEELKTVRDSLQKALTKTAYEQEKAPKTVEETTKKRGRKRIKSTKRSAVGASKSRSRSRSKSTARKHVFDKQEGPTSPRAQLPQKDGSHAQKRRGSTPLLPTDPVPQDSTISIPLPVRSIARTALHSNSKEETEPNAVRSTKTEVDRTLSMKTEEMIHSDVNSACVAEDQQAAVELPSKSRRGSFASMHLSSRRSSVVVPEDSHVSVNTTSVSDISIEVGKLKTRLRVGDLERKVLGEERDEAREKLNTATEKYNELAGEHQGTLSRLAALQKEHKRFVTDSEYEVGKLQEELAAAEKKLQNSAAAYANRVSEEVLSARKQMHQETHLNLELQNEMNGLKQRLAAATQELRLSRMQASHAKELSKSMRQDVKRLREQLFRTEQESAEKDAKRQKEMEEEASRGGAYNTLQKQVHDNVKQISVLTQRLESGRLAMMDLKAKQEADLKAVQAQADEHRLRYLDKEKAIRNMLEANKELLKVKERELEEASARAIMMENVVMEERQQFAESQTAMRAKLKQHKKQDLSLSLETAQTTENDTRERSTSDWA